MGRTSPRARGNVRLTIHERKGGPSRGPTSGPRLAALIWGMVAFLVYAGFTHRHVFGAGNDTSRLAPIQSIVEQGTWAINGSRYAWTQDRVTLGGIDYSNKPPILAFVGAGLYWPLFAVGVTFATQEAFVVWFLTVTMTGLPAAVLVGCFHVALARAYPSGPVHLTTGALAFGTLLTSFSGTLNSHPLAALLAFLSCWSSWERRAVGAGSALALLCCVEPLTGALFLPAVLWMTRAQWPRTLLPLAVGAVLFIAMNWLTCGSLLLTKMVAGGDDWGSGNAAKVFGVALPESPWYPLECLFGWHGFFTVSPVLAFGALGGSRAWRDGPLQVASARATLLTVVVFVLVHCVLAGAYGGWSYGFRYLIPVMPLVMFFAPLGVEVLGRVTFALVTAVSVPLALLGMYHPWPPGYEERATANQPAAVVTNPIAGNLACLLVECAPDSSLAESFAKVAIHRDTKKQIEYLRIFFASKGMSVTVGLE